MWLRHALKFLVLISLISACSSPDRQVVDKLNLLSYAYHYRSLDSTEYYARQALSLSADRADVRNEVYAEALNNLAFVSIARMRYDEAARQLDSIPALTANQIELLVANVQQMRLCQRRSRNREFYDYREKALQALRRIDEERSSLTLRQQQRLLYAETELAIVTSTYYYYVGLEQQSIEALDGLEPIACQDTAQWLNYLYNVGAGGVITTGTQEEINQQEFDCLMRCLIMSRQQDYPYFEANALEALAEHLINPIHREVLLRNNSYALDLINMDDVSVESLPAQLAEEALCLFQQYGDVYQIAGAYRTLASCSRALGNHSSALYYLEQALSDTLINQAPDLVASIREQLSVAYSAIDDKAASDLHRNVYLDLQEQTRQDRWLEARAAQLDQSVARLNLLLFAIGAVIILLIAQVLFFNLRYRRKQKQQEAALQNEKMEEIREQLAISRLHVDDGERRHLEQRARISLASSITPFIDRLIYEVAHKPVDQEYICELTDKINEQNDLLTQWIQLRQGQLSLHIETFALQPLFDLVAHGRNSFQQKGVELIFEPTSLMVKADRVLTLFMLNTLTDNARKFTPSGGRVEVSAKESEEYVEVSITDTGAGMSEEELSHVFDRQNIMDSTSYEVKSSTSNEAKGGNSNEVKGNKQVSHGFGLINCRGIIEKYRKTSRIFSVCLLDAESKQGRGSRFFFRLPKGVAKLLLAFVLLTGSLSSTQVQAQVSPLSMASAYADSAYYANVNGNYVRALIFSDICRQALNDYYRNKYPGKTDTLLAIGDISRQPAEVTWLHDSVQVNYHILLRMRNESAVAALALHQWDIYSFNNRIYTQLFKELSADVQLEEYCRRLQQTEANYTIAIVLLVFLFVIILMAVAAQMLQAIRHRAIRQKQQQESIDMLEDEMHRVELEEARLHVSNQVLDNCLSALKHETMYYPSRIRQLVDSGHTSDLPEVVGYYRDLYGILLHQAAEQVEGVKLHIKPLDHELLGDENLIRYLFELLRKQSGQKEPLQVTYQPKDERHMECRVLMPQLQLSDEELSHLFVPRSGGESSQSIPFLLCRQIVRDHGEATGRRGCGMWAEKSADNIPTIVIILPRQICKTSK